MKSSSELMAEAFDRARSQWRRRGETLEMAPARRAAPAGPFTIAISRETGAGGSKIARAIGEELGWLVYDRELLDEISQQTGVQTELLETLDERRSHWLTNYLEAFGGVRSMGGETYARKVAKTMLALSVHGECIVVGRGAAAVLPPATTLRVRLIASPADRIVRVAEDEGLSEAAARDRVERTDRDRAAFVRQFFHRDVNDVQLYDLVINTSRFSTEQAAGLIVKALRLLEQSTPAEPQKAAAR